MSDPTAPGGDAPVAQPAPSAEPSGAGTGPQAQAPAPANEEPGTRNREPETGRAPIPASEAGEQGVNPPTDGGIPADAATPSRAGAPGSPFSGGACPARQAGPAGARPEPTPDSPPPMEAAPGDGDTALEGAEGDDAPPESFAAASWAEQPPPQDEPQDDSNSDLPADAAPPAGEDLPEASPDASLEDSPMPAEQGVVISDGPEPDAIETADAAEPAESAEPADGQDHACGACAACPQATIVTEAAGEAPASAEPGEARPAEPADRGRPARPSVIVRYGVMRNIGEFRHNVDPPPPRGAKVVVRTERGVELGEVVTPISREGCACGYITAEGLRDYARNNGPEYPFRRDGRVLRVANPQDVIDYRHLQQSAREAATYCRQEIRAMGTQMKLVTVEHLLGGERIIFYFASEQRVDFRDLVRRLASVYRTRIEMRQVGARDEARLVADYERCGQQCCCQSYLKDLKPVSMRMAKTQKATLDPSKISGRCGRLMCCLRYEDIAYEELRKKLPRKNIFVRTATVVGKVVDTQIITQLVRLLLVDNTTVVVGNDEILERDVEPPVRPEVRVRPAPPPRGERVFLRTMAEGPGQGQEGQPAAGGPAAGPAEPVPTAVADGADDRQAIAPPSEGEALGGDGPADDEPGTDQPQERAEAQGGPPAAGRRGPEGEGPAEGGGPDGKKRRRRRSRHKKGGPEGQAQGPDQGPGQGQGQSQGSGQGQGRGPRPPGGQQGDRQRGPRDDRQAGPRDQRPPRSEPNRQFAPQPPSQPAPEPADQAGPDAGGGPPEDIAPPPARSEEGPTASPEDFRPPVEAPSQVDGGQDFGPQDSGGPEQDGDDGSPAPAQPRPGPGGGPPQNQGQAQDPGGGQGRRRRRHRGGRRGPK